jgi:MOSC domain-containing protein
MTEPSKEELLRSPPGGVDTESLRFDGLRGDRKRHLDRAALEAGIASLRAPLDEGTVDLLLARGPNGERHLPQEAVLTLREGMPGDRWAAQEKYGPDYQLATTRTDFARLIANGQPLELHGNNLFLSLDLSSENLPEGTLVRAGEALLRVTPVAHNGCKKWVQRFGLHPMQLNLDRAHRHLHLRGIYLRVVEEGRVRVGDGAIVVERGPKRA